MRLVSVLTATSAGLDWPGNAAWMPVERLDRRGAARQRLQARLRGVELERRDRQRRQQPRRQHRRHRRVPEHRGEDAPTRPGSRRTGRRSRPSSGIRPFSTRSPSFDSTAGSTVSDPTIATATTIIVAIENDSNVLSPENSIPAIAIITVAPEISTERPEVAAAAWSAARSPRPAARSSRSRRR